MMIIQIFCTNYLLFRFSFELNNHKILRSLPYQPEHIPFATSCTKGFHLPIEQNPPCEKKTYSCTQKNSHLQNNLQLWPFQKTSACWATFHFTSSRTGSSGGRWKMVANSLSQFVVDTTESERLSWVFRTRRSVPPPSQHLWHWEGETNGA